MPDRVASADGEWRLEQDGRLLLTVSCAPDDAPLLAFKRTRSRFSFRFHMRRDATGPIPSAATIEWRHPRGADATVSAQDGKPTRAPVLSMSSLQLPALLRHPHGRIALLTADGPAAGTARRATGLGRDGAPRWTLELPFRKSRGGGASTPWLHLYSAPSPRQLLEAIASNPPASGAADAIRQAISMPTGEGMTPAAKLAADIMFRPAEEERWLRCEPGEYATALKRFGQVWIAASLNGGRQRVQTLLLDFLPAGVDFEMDGECDDPALCLAHPMPSDPSVLPPPGTPWTRADKVSISMAANGGSVIALIPRGQSVQPPGTDGRCSSR